MQNKEIATDGLMKKTMRGAQIWLLCLAVLGASLASAQQPQGADAGSGTNRQVAGPTGPRNNGDGKQDGSQSTQPGKDGRPNQNDHPATRPGRPGNGYLHPPGRPAPRPPAYYPPHYGHPHYGPPRPHYVWGGGNGWRLRHFFLGDMRPVRGWHRHPLFIGGYFPQAHLARIQPIPEHLMVYLPPVPPGYEIGYFDGYCLIYDPYTLRIESVLDLYRY
jgi:hypothetical protein